MRIGNIELSSRVALAPMAGVTDVAFRQICSELGAALTCTELISSRALCYRDKKTFSLLTQFPGVGHNSWDPAYLTTDLIPWLLGEDVERK